MSVAKTRIVYLTWDVGGTHRSTAASNTRRTFYDGNLELIRVSGVGSLKGNYVGAKTDAGDVPRGSYWVSNPRNGARRTVPAARRDR